MSWLLNENQILRYNTQHIWQGRYIKADYIEFKNSSDGTNVDNNAFIDTGITDDSTTSWDINFEFVTLATENWVAGVANLDVSLYYAYAGTSSGYSWHTDHVAYSTGSPTTGTFITATKQSGGSTYSMPYNIIVGARNWCNTTTPTLNPSNGIARFKVYYFDIKKNGVKVAEFFPAYDTVNEEWGMYDVIGGQFHGNAGSAGTYVYNGYYVPSAFLTPSELPYDYEHRNMSDWYMNSDDIVSNDIIPTPIGWQQPYPVGKWYMTNTLRLTANGIPDRLRWTKPYPASVWYFDEELDHVFNSMIPLPLVAPVPQTGAFMNCSNLHYVRIPRSVAEIGSAAFAGTSLTKVCISRQCRYSPGSFPDGCTIIFYEDLYDVDYDEFVAGVNAFRSTEIHPYDESSGIQPEIP